MGSKQALGRGNANMQLETASRKAMLDRANVAISALECYLVRGAYGGARSACWPGVAATEPVAAVAAGATELQVATSSRHRLLSAPWMHLFAWHLCARALRAHGLGRVLLHEHAYCCSKICTSLR